MKEGVEVVGIDINYIKQRLEILKQDPVVQELVYLQTVLKQAKDGAEVDNVPKGTDKGTGKTPVKKSD